MSFQSTGHTGKAQNQLPKSTNQEANRKVQMIASMAGITNVVQEGAQSGPKCNFVRAPTARRSVVTNLAMQGVPLDFIARLGGWNNMDTLKKYLLVSGMDVAMVAEGCEFFSRILNWNKKILFCRKILV